MKLAVPALGRRRRLAATTAASVVALAGFLVAPAAMPAGAAPSLSIAVKGNHLVNGSGATVQLRGVDETSTEYWCTFDRKGASDYSTYDLPSEAKYIASWHANAVRVPLNEDCWLGLNGLPSVPGSSVTGYRKAVVSFVKDVNAQHMYAIVDLHWSANGSAKADGQRQLADNHSVAFWKSVARTFKSNHAVIFDAFNEPVGLSASDTGGQAFPVSWGCWLHGGCTVSNVALGNGSYSSATFTAVGMQALVNAIRSTGAKQPIMLGGLDWSNDLSGWLSHEPTDSVKPAQLVASYHNYEGSDCASLACWGSTISAVAAKVPVVTGEFGQFSCTNPGFDTQWMDWADAHGISYLAWAFASSDNAPTCGTPSYGPYLLTPDLSSPEATNGVQVYDHLTSFPKP